MTTTLTTTDRNDLEKYESVIERGYQSFVESGQALLNIRDRRLYRQTHDTFEDYCQERWGFNRARGRQLIEASIAVQTLPKNLDTNVSTEGAARELRKVPETHRVAVVTSATKNGVATGSAIKKAAEKVQQISPVVVDATGYPIPKEGVAIWHRAGEIQDMLTAVSKLKSQIKNGWEDKDLLFAGVGQHAVDELERVYYTLANAKPYAVCTQCQGHPRINKEPCGFCCGTGFISKRSYDSHVPEEIKRIRIKSIKK